MSGKIEAHIATLGLVLPTASTPSANYVPFVLSGNLLFIAGQLPLRDGAVTCVGQVGGEVSVDEAYEAAKTCGLNVIAQAKAALGDLDRVKRVVKLTGFISCVVPFAEQPKVINGASDLMVAVFGDAGRHARAAVGSSALPRGAAVEVDAIFEVA